MEIDFEINIFSFGTLWKLGMRFHPRTCSHVEDYTYNKSKQADIINTKNSKGKKNCKVLFINMKNTNLQIALHFPFFFTK